MANKTEQLEQTIDKSTVRAFSECHLLEGSSASEGEAHPRGEQSQSDPNRGIIFHLRGFSCSYLSDPSRVVLAAAAPSLPRGRPPERQRHAGRALSRHSQRPVSLPGRDPHGAAPSGRRVRERE